MMFLSELESKVLHVDVDALLYVAPILYYITCYDNNYNFKLNLFDNDLN